MLDEPQTVYVGLVLLGFLCVAVLFVAARYYRLKASIAWNAIADGADSASTGAPVQGRQLGFNDVEASTPSTGAHADSLAYECECRSLRRSKRKQRSSECKREEILTHTHLLTSYTKLTYIWFFGGVSWATMLARAYATICPLLAKADIAVPWRIMVNRRKLARPQPLRWTIALDWHRVVFKHDASP